MMACRDLPGDQKKENRPVEKLPIVYTHLYTHVAESARDRRMA